MRDDFYYNDGYIESLNEQIDSLQQDYYDMQLGHECDIQELELRVLKNFIVSMPSSYREENMNWVVVRDILMTGTQYIDRTSCINKCIDLGIFPEAHIL